MSVPRPDRATLHAAAMQALIADGARASVGVGDATGMARLRCVAGGRVVGLDLAGAVFARAGVRCRPRSGDGDPVVPGGVVADLGGPVAAIDAAAPTAIRLLERSSRIAAGALDGDPGDPIDAYVTSFRTSGRLSGPDRVGHDGPSFRLEMLDT